MIAKGIDSLRACSDDRKQVETWMKTILFDKDAPCLASIGETSQ